MNNIVPVNGHLIIKPRKQETFLPTERGTFQEIGEVVAIAYDIEEGRDKLLSFYTGGVMPALFVVGDEVYFDSWLSAKYPTGEGDEEFYLVPWKDVRAVKRKNA